MSYNIDTWRTKKLEDLEIPYAAAEKLSDVSIKIDRLDLTEPIVHIDGDAEVFEIVGVLQGTNILVNKIECYGEGSGWVWEELLEMLKSSTGVLIATQVWEGGDSITRLIVQDGEVTEEQIEL